MASTMHGDTDKLKQVKAEIEEVKVEIAEVKGKLRQTDLSKEERAQLQQEKSLLQHKENLLREKELKLIDQQAAGEGQQDMQAIRDDYVRHLQETVEKQQAANEAQREAMLELQKARQELQAAARDRRARPSTSDTDYYKKQKAEKHTAGHEAWFNEMRPAAPAPAQAAPPVLKSPKDLGTKFDGSETMVMVAIPPVLHGYTTQIILYNFQDQDDFRDWLNTEQIGGLIKVDDPEDKHKVAIRRLDMLEPGVAYTPSGIGKDAFRTVHREVQHLQQSRKDEYGRALLDHVRKVDPAQDYKLDELSRLQLIANNRVAEHDVVIKGNTIAYIGSHKMYVEGSRPVKDIAERCEELAKLPNQLPQIIRPSFMAERVQPSAEISIRKACTDRNVLRMQRSGRAISVVSHLRAPRMVLHF